MTAEHTTLTLDRNPVSVYMGGKSESSLPTMRHALNTMARIVDANADALTLDWAALRFEHTAAIRARLAERYPASTVNKMLSYLRAVLKTCWRLGLMDSESYARAADLDRVKGERLPAGRSLTLGEITALFSACAADPTAAGTRDAAMLALLRLGLRREEVAALVLADLDMGDTAIKVTGKNNKQRLVPLNPGAVDALADWLHLRGETPGPLLFAVNKSGRIVRHGLTSQTVYDVLLKRSGEAHVRPASPHDFRRSFAGDMLDVCGDLAVVQRLMGHSDPKTTTMYDRRGQHAAARAVSGLFTPYSRRAELVC